LTFGIGWWSWRKARWAWQGARNISSPPSEEEMESQRHWP
jgi:hypothetical protein